MNIISFSLKWYLDECFCFGAAGSLQLSDPSILNVKLAQWVTFAPLTTFSTFASSSASLSRSVPQGSVRSYLVCLVQILRSFKGHFRDIMIHIFSCLCSLSISLMAPSPHLLNPHSNVTQTTPSTVSKVFNSFLFFDCVLNWDENDYSHFKFPILPLLLIKDSPGLITSSPGCKASDCQI